MNIFDRFKLIIESKDQTQTAWAEELGIKKSTINAVLKGKTRPALAVCLPLLKMGYSINWLLTGEGAMLVKDIPEEEFTLPPSIQDLIREKEEQEQMITSLNNTLQEQAEEIERLKDHLRDKNTLLAFYREKFPYTEQKNSM